MFHKHLELFTLPPPCSVFMLLLLMLFLFSHQENSCAWTGTQTWARTSGRPVKCVTCAGCFLVRPCHRIEAKISSSWSLRRFPPLLLSQDWEIFAGKGHISLHKCCHDQYSLLVPFSFYFLCLVKQIASWDEIMACGRSKTMVGRNEWDGKKLKRKRRGWRTYRNC